MFCNNGNGVEEKWRWWMQAGMIWMISVEVENDWYDWPDWV
jgi:hypothetical protein